MKPEAQRIAIAEACGWKKPACDRIGGCLKETGLRSELVWSCKCDTDEYSLPNYLSDLNAMHEAEKVLSKSQHSAYIKQLGKLTAKPYEAADVFDALMSTVFATAAQRAEAFLRALNLWTD